MPPFIEAKWKELLAGGTNIDSNPSGAFDTNGWPELRTRLAKFRATLQHYARQCSSSAPMLPSEAKARLSNICADILSECDQLLKRMKACKPVGEGIPRKTKPPSGRRLSWADAITELSQVLGVLKKTHRDLDSSHWRAEWVPTRADYNIVTWDVEGMAGAIAIIVDRLREA